MNEQQSQSSRKIIISREIDNQVANQVISAIAEINEYDDQMSALTTYKPEPIEIIINSHGGTATDGFAIIGAMDASQTPIVTYGFGIVASMALGIFAKGDYRISSEYTRFMYHSLSYGLQGFIKDHEDYRKETNVLQKMYNDLFKDTKLTQKIMDDVRHKKIDFYFSAKRAVELGFVDYIIEKNRFVDISNDSNSKIQ